MAQNETWLTHDLLEAVKVQYLDGNFFSMDNAGNLIGVTLTRDGEAYSGGGSVSANVIRADGGTVAVTGALSGNTATVVLPQAAYAVPGVISVVIKLTVSGEVTTVAAIVANVYRSSTDTTVDPGTIIPSVQALIAAIDSAVASIPADYSSLWAKLAPAFSNSSAYISGQYVTYNGGLYRFSVDHTAGDWDSTQVTSVNIGGELKNLKDNFAPDYSTLTFPVSYGTYCTHNGKLFKASQDIAEAEAWNSGHWAVVNVMGQVGSAVLYTPQSLNNAQKLQAANNIGAVSTQWGQTLTDDQKQAVRSKINLPLIDWDANYTDSQIQIAQNNFAISELAPKYKPTGVSYAVGDIRSFNGDTYICNTAIEADAGNFDYDKWTWIPPVPQPVSYGKDQTTGFGALTPKQQATARNNIGMGIVPELYGAKGDGETDDKDALGMAIATACSKGVPLYFSPGKTYLTSGHLYVTKRINIYGNGATIKATGTAQNQVILVESEEGQFPTVQGKGLIENLTIDANGRNIGLNVFKAQGWELQNLDICGFENIGALIRNNFEIFAKNIRIAGTNNPSSKGMQVQASDSRFENIVTKNVGTGVVNIGSCNFYTHVHAWNTASEIVPTSVMIENQADLHLEESYIDTCAIGIKQASNLPVCVSGLVVYRNNSYMDDDFCPVLFGVTSSANAEKIKGYNIVNNSADDLYNLFDVDLTQTNKFDWVDNNDKSILAMGNVPKNMTLHQLPDSVWGSKAAGIARKIISDQYATDNLPYNFRQAFDADWNEEKLVGGTVAWNQLAPELANGKGYTYYSAQCDYTFADGVVTCVNRSDATSVADIINNLIRVPDGHKTLMVFDTMAAEAGSNIVVRYVAWDTIKTFTNCPSDAFLNCSILFSGVAKRIQILGKSGFKLRNWMLFDLTQMFGSTIADAIYAMEQTTAGAGVAWFRKLFPNDYYAYDSGSLQSVQAESHVMRGFNQWDEEWESGQFNGNVSTGIIGKAFDNTRIRSKNDIAVLPNTSYYLKSTQPLFAYYLDGNGIWLNRESSNGTTIAKNSVFTTPADCRYIKFFTVNTPTYNHDICINLSDPAKNGTYEPYKSITYPLGNVVLRGVPQIDGNGNLYYDGDEYQHDGTVTRRYNYVVLNGTESGWNKSSSYQGSFYIRFSTAQIPLFKAFSYCKTPNLISVISTSNYAEGCVYVESESINFWYPNMSEVTLNNFKTWLATNPIYLVYKLATPTTETTYPFEIAQDVFYDGTEEYVDRAVTAETPTRDVAIPVGHESKYYKDFRREVREMIANVQALILENT